MMPPALAVASVAIATAITTLLWPYNKNAPFAIYYVAILITANYGTTWAGGLAILLSLLGVDYFFLAPRHHLSIDFESIQAIPTVAVVAAVMLFLVDRRRHSDNKMRESEARLSNLIHFATDAIISVDSGQRIELFNAAAEKMFGYGARDAIGKPLQRFFPQRLQDGLPVHQNFSQAELTSALRADGQEFPVEASISGIETDGGKLFTVIIRDISQRRAHESEIERLNRLNTVLARVNQAIVLGPARDELFGTICKILVEAGGFAMAWIGWPDAEEHLLLPIAQFGDDDGYLKKVGIRTDDQPEGHGPAGTAFREGRPYICNDIHRDPAMLPWLDALDRRGYRSVATFPIRLRDEVCATLTINSTELEFFQDREVALLSDVARDVSFALDNLALEDERQQAQAMAKRLAAIVESTDDGIISKTLEGIITSWNPAAERIFGYTEQEIIGRHIEILIPPDRSAEETAILASIAAGEHVRHFETIRLRKGGKAIEVSVTVSPIRGPDTLPRGPTKIIGASKIVRDISERKRVEGIARRERLFSDELLESMPGILYLYNQQGQFLRWNQNFLRVSGYTADEVSRLHPLDFFSGDEKPLVQDRIAEVFDKGESFVEAAFISKDGHSTPYLLTGRRLMFDGAICLVGLGIDITERTRAEQMLQEYARRLQATSRQLLEVQENERRRVARELHDTVGQELTALSLNLTMMRAGMPTGLTDAVGRHLDDSQKLLEETTQHLRSVMVELRPPGIDELGLLAALKEHTRRVAQRSGVSVRVSGLEPKPRFSPNVAIALFRIAQEALNNTIKHAGAREISIELRQQPDSILLTVADNGSGFDTARKPVIGVYGMGMTTMRERAEAIGAQLSMDSAMGQGTRVIVRIPSSVGLAE